MAKAKARRAKTAPMRPRRPKQLEPAIGFEPDYVDLDSGEFRYLPKERDERARAVLIECIRPYVRGGMWFRKPTSAERFLENAMLAIGTYTRQHGDKARVDRAKAKLLLSEAQDAVAKAVSHLKAVADWRELSDFLKDMYVAERREEAKRLIADKTPSRKSRMSESASRELTVRDRLAEQYSLFAPRRLAAALARLEPVLALATQRVEFQPGDKQRDEIAQRFVDDMAFAWGAATGAPPTYAKPSPYSRRPSPFAALLSAVNIDVLEQDQQSKNGFRDYAVKAVSHIKALLKAQPL